MTWQNQPAAPATPATTTSGDGYREWDVTDHAEDIIAGAAPDHGWLVRDATEGDLLGAEQWFTSRHLILEPPRTQSPQLVLRFDGPPVPPPPAPPVPTPAAVTCGQTLVASTLVDQRPLRLPVRRPDHRRPEHRRRPRRPRHRRARLPGLRSGGRPPRRHPQPRTRQRARPQRHRPTVRPGRPALRRGDVQRHRGPHIERNSVAGVQLIDADNGRTGNIIRNNLLISNGETSIWLLNGSEGTLIADNSFLGNAGMAVHLWDSSHNRIEGNEVSGTPIDPALGSDGGIMLEGRSDNEIVGNSIAETGDAGVILVDGSHRNLIEANVMAAAGDAGVTIADSDGNDVVGNTSHLGSDAGAVLSNAHGGSVVDNDVRFNPTGVDLASSDGNVIEGNNADFSSGTGIEVSGIGNEISENSANNTLADGFAIDGDAVDELGVPDPDLGNLIEDNTANGNLGNGVTVEGVGPHDHRQHRQQQRRLGHQRGRGQRRRRRQHRQRQRRAACSAPAWSARPARPLRRRARRHGARHVVRCRLRRTRTESSKPCSSRSKALTTSPGDGAALRVPARRRPRRRAAARTAELEPPEPGDPSVFEGENWVECANPVTFRLLHRVSTRSKCAPSTRRRTSTPPRPAYTWTVNSMPPGPDSSPPSTFLLETPSDPSTSTSATFRFAGSDNATPGSDLTYVCALVTPSGPVPAPAPCTSPATHNSLGLGVHTFSVHAVDARRQR